MHRSYYQWEPQKMSTSHHSRAAPFYRNVSVGAYGNQTHHPKFSRLSTRPKLSSKTNMKRDFYYQQANNKAKKYIENIRISV